MKSGSWVLDSHFYFLSRPKLSPKYHFQSILMIWVRFAKTAKYYETQLYIITFDKSAD